MRRRRKRESNGTSLEAEEVTQPEVEAPSVDDVKPQAEKEEAKAEKEEAKAEKVEEKTEEEKPKDKEPAKEASAESGTESQVVAPAVKPPVVPKPVVLVDAHGHPPPKPQNEPMITFTMYCRQKGIPDRHQAGMHAYTKVQRATFAEWERVFSHY